MPRPPQTTLPASIDVDGNAVRRARMALGHSIVGFAPTVPIAFGYLAQVERGERRMSPPKFKALVAALGMVGREDELMVEAG